MIVRDASILARCGRCDEWCIYGVGDRGLGIVLEPVATRGYGWFLRGDGSYRRWRGDAPHWSQRAHHCPITAHAR